MRESKHNPIEKTSRLNYTYFMGETRVQPLFSTESPSIRQDYDGLLFCEFSGHCAHFHQLITCSVKNTNKMSVDNYILKK